MDPVTQSIFTSVVTGIVAGLIVWIITTFKIKWKIWQSITIAASISIILMVGLYLTIFQPLIIVPQLSGSQAQADQVIINNNLVPEHRLQYSLETAKGDVIPNSQYPKPGTQVNPGTHVIFTISMGPDINPTPTPTVISTTPVTTITAPVSATTSVSLFSPKSGEKLKLWSDATGVYTCEVSGISSGIVQSGSELLLWIHPVNPPSDIPGWYLQRYPNGVGTINNDGTWSGSVQLGNAQWPPHEGDLFDVSVTVTDSNTTSQLMALPGVVVRNQPVGKPSEKATGVVVTL